MKQALSGAVLAILICGLYASAQQPHVTTTLPSATVKLNGASGGGGSGTGFTYDAGEGAWIFTPASGNSDTRILSDGISLQDAAGTDIMAMDATLGATTYVAGRLAADAIEVRGINSLSATGTITATNVTCSTGGGAVVGTLNATAGNVGRFVYVTRDGANTCTIGVASGQTLDGVTDGTTTVPSAGWKTFVQTTSTAWVTAGSYPVTGTLSGLTTGAVPYASSATALADSPLIRVDANTVEQRNGTNPQTFQLYNTYSGAGANYERAGMKWVGNDFQFGTFAPAGTGTSRLGYLYGNGVIVGYWTSSGFTFEVNANMNQDLVLRRWLIFDDTNFAKPTCGSGWRGWTYTNHGASNVPDTIEPCLKNADGTYEWATMATGHGLPPTAPAGGGTCGTGTPALNADAHDPAGQLTVGGGSPTSCAITFGKTYAVAPSCTANGSATAGILVATTTSTVTLSATALGAGEVLHYVCGGFR